jgi:ion channel-forming bestrophin family protein
MIIYNPKDWWKLIFYFQKADTFRKLLPAMIAVASYTFLFYFVENKLLHLNQVRNPIALHSLVGFVLSLLLVFRTNTAYDRWWEGRKLWGAFTNNSRNLALKIKAFLPNNPEVLNFFAYQIGNYLHATKDRLRGANALDHMVFSNEYSLEFYQKSKNIPNKIIGTIFSKINALYLNGSISGDQFIILNNELSSFTDNFGGCERIKNTPIPVSYNIFIKKMIFIYVFSMPFSFVLEFGYLAIPIVTLVFYSFAGIEIIAEEIEDPFGNDNNDLELDAIVKNVKANLKEILITENASN